MKQALADQSEVLDEDRSETSYLIDDTVDPYHILSSHGSEEDTSRYNTSGFIVEGLLFASYSVAGVLLGLLQHMSGCQPLLLKNSQVKLCLVSKFTKCCIRYFWPQIY